MILNLSNTNSTKTINSLQQYYDYYYTFQVIPICEYDNDDENDSVDSTIPARDSSMEQKKTNQECNSNKIAKKSVRFNDSVETITSCEPVMTDDEKRIAFYTKYELKTMKKHAKLYAKFVHTIDSMTFHELLNDMSSYNFDDNTNEEEIICLRGLEKYVKVKQQPTSSTTSTSSVSYSARRRMLIQNVLLEQKRRQKSSEEEKRDDVEDEHYDNDEHIRNTSMTISKTCRDFAYKIAQKSYCIPAFGF